MTDHAALREKPCRRCAICEGLDHHWLDDCDETGEPTRLGPMKENGCQIELLMSDGTEADIACCVDCCNGHRLSSSIAPILPETTP